MASRDLVTSSDMWREIAHRLLVLVLSLALGTAIVARSVQATQLDLGVGAMSTSMPMNGDCNGCAGSDKAMLPGACAASFCSIIMSVAPIAVTFDAVVIGVVSPAVQPAIAGHIFPPDPYPPRSSVLS